MRRLTPLVTFATLLIATLTISPALLAQRSGSTKPIRVVVSGGMTLPQGDLKDFHDTGLHADASLLLTFAGLPVTVRPELSLTRLKQKLPPVNTLLRPIGYTGSDSTQTTQFLGAIGNIEVPLAAGLYILGGVGVLNLDASSENETQLTMNAGAGFRFHLGRAEGFVEARLGTASYNAGTFGYSKAQFIPVSFGLAF
ncbi:MAG: hypothetical protein IPP90_06560 [Gemmatimonadaceae bacterium]|nr:hypothetical protein [Gemmatimonadaceae bacterium]